MCQAVKDANLKTKLYAIDTWKGDKQAGFYGEEVISEVIKIKNQFYQKQKIILLRTSFDEAFLKYSKQSIDLLHIDGLHTYDAVKHDLSNWLSKVSKDGVVVLHDIEEKKEDFGVYKLWAELKQKYCTIEFHHSHGLGILFLNKEKNNKVKMFETVWQKYYPLLCDNINLKKNIQSYKLHLLKALDEVTTYKNELQSAQNEIARLHNDLNKILNTVKWKVLVRLQRLTPPHIKKLALPILSTAFKQMQKSKLMYERYRNILYIKQSGLFDSQWYLKTYHDVKKAKLNPLIHYLDFGAYEGRNPSTRFDSSIYLQQNPDVVAVKMNPLVHYMKFGIYNNIVPQSPVNSQYQLWLNKHRLKKEDREKQKIDSLQFKYRPKISIITPVFDPPEKFLKECIESVINQTYDNWELCLADDHSTKNYVREILDEYKGRDKRIKVVYRRSNGHICNASNSALKLATGKYVGLLDDDDILWPNALFENIKAINRNPLAAFLYSDEDKLEENGIEHTDPFFKPDWSPDYLRQINYITHFAIIKKSLMNKLNGFQKGLEGAQDWDVFLRATNEIEKSGNERKKIIHIPTVLYSWRKSSTSTASEKHVGNIKRYAYENQKTVLLRDLKNRNYKGTVTSTEETSLNYIHYSIEKGPFVSIIIPTKNKYGLISSCINSIMNKSTYTHFEIILIDTGTTEEDTIKYYDILKENATISIHHWNKPFNFAAICNWGATLAKGKHLIFLNNDTKVITPDWIENMLAHSQHPKTGAVGIKLLFDDNTIQHAGVIIGLSGFAGHIFQNTMNKLHTHIPFGKIHWTRNYSAVTGACLMIKKQLYTKVGGMNEKFTMCGNDVDLCLRIYELGYYNVYSANAELFHYETQTRDPNNIPQKDYEFSIKSYSKYLKKGDPFFNRNMSYWNLSPTIKTKPEENSYDFAKQYSTNGNITMYKAREFKDIDITSQQQESLLVTQWYDFSLHDLNKNYETINKNAAPVVVKSVCWFIPEFNTLYAGIHNILCFANFLSKHNIKNTFIVDTDHTLYPIKQMIYDNFENLNTSTILNNYQIKTLNHADISIATLWTTAYHLLKFNKTKRKLYFLQDYESMFYPSGSESALVENTYRFGFTAIASTEILHNIYQNKFHGKSVLLKSSIDFTKFYNRKSYVSKPPYNVFFYGRPNHPRNGFELGIEALKKLKKMMGDNVNIYSAGADWNPKQFNVDKIINNLGVLPLEKLPNFYRSMDAGLFLMFSGHPGVIPFELMASKCPVVLNSNNTEGWNQIYINKKNCIVSMNSATQIAENIREILINQKLRKNIIGNSLTFLKLQFPDYAQEAEKVLDFISNKV